MNEKAHVSRELNEKHRKILEGLLKNPENRQCADCKSKGPRWASVNLGVFICMQCSGIHRSLGVHISKVRSATLDTWLPEQVAFIQSMGNGKANSYWEAELPPNYDRVGIENFIRAKYEEKRWVPKKQRSKSSPKMLDERAPSYGQGPTEKSGHGHVTNYENSFEERTIQASSRNENLPATRISLPVPPKGPNPVVTPVREPETVVVAPAEATTTPPTVAPPKFECATDLFNMMSIDDAPSENASDSGAASTDDNDWAGFQSAGDTSVTDKNDPPKAGEKNAQSATGIENLFNDSPPLTTNQVPEKPQKDVKNDILSLFEKSNTVQPYAMHQQQQLALLAHQQSLLMAAAAKSAPGNTQQSPSNGAIIPTEQQLALLEQQKSLLMAAAAKSAPGNTQQPPSTTTSIPTQQQLALLAHQQSLLMAAAVKAAPGNTQQPPSTGTSIPTQAWPNIGYQIPGIMMPVGAQADLQKLMQTMQMGQTQQVGNNVASSSFYALGQVTPASGAAINGASKPQTASSVSSTNSPQTGKDYDFSSLTQGLFTKR
ncbi:NEVERSHED, ARF-GAP domain 5 [Hibiscus trionum]|uniref:NEVERSHED, ARF-GAP domain 5 n=1 Tax=Hibiscus trionum TaxID=183268 RepID=A0A9W7MQV0_HIBTR|nr:NEVERSHED, ARF-GAP domain 5 [Hibiscus trionum]